VTATSSVIAGSSLLVTSAIGIGTLVVTRRRDNVAASDADDDRRVNEFGVVADLAQQIATQIVGSADAERLRCDKRIAAIEAATEAKVAELQGHVKVCDEEVARLRAEMDALTAP
jgi:hypothetical protein